MEVFREVHPQQVCQPPRHVAVAGQGVVERKGGDDDEHPGGQHRLGGVGQLFDGLLHRRVALRQNDQLG